MREINASDLPRVMQCAGALILADRAPRFDNLPSESRRESEAAHHALNVALTDPQKQLAGMTCPNGYIVTAEMGEHVTSIAAVIRYRDFGATIHSAPVMDWSLPDAIVIRSKPDCVAWNSETHVLYIDELKYGWRIVDVENNWQMIAAAIGGVIRSGYTPKRIVYTLHQPRPYHPNGTMRQCEMTREQLGEARLAVMERVKRTDDTCLTGPECYGCRAAGICPSASAAASAAIDVSYSGTGDDISSDTLGFELMMLARAEEAIKIRKKALEEIATHRITAGSHVPHWSLQSSQGNRKWSEGVNASLIQSMTGIDVSDVGIVSPAQAEKRGVSKEIVASFTTRPSNGFRLVRQDLKEVFK